MAQHRSAPAMGRGHGAAGAAGVAGAAARPSAPGPGPDLGPEPQAPRRDLAWCGPGRFAVLGGSDGKRSLETTELLAGGGAAGFVGLGGGGLGGTAFEPGPKMQEARSGCAAAYLGGGLALVVGGSTGSRSLDTSEVLDLQTMSFAPGPRLASGGRTTCAAAVDAQGRWLVVFGGRDRGARLDTTEVLDVAAMTFAPGPPMAARRNLCAAAALAGGPAGSALRLIVVGGQDGATPLDTTEVLDLTTMAFAPGPRLAGGPRHSCAACALPDGRVLVAGGLGAGGARLTSTEVLDAGATEFRPGPALSKPRSGCSAMLLDANRLLIAGGQDGESRLRTAEVLDLRTMQFSPGPRLAAPGRGGCAAAATFWPWPC